MHKILIKYENNRRNERNLNVNVNLNKIIIQSLSEAKYFPCQDIYEGYIM